jgi:ubiquinone/menaquinone biosynthesis C-methylase UbiE
MCLRPLMRWCRTWRGWSVGCGAVAPLRCGSLTDMGQTELPDPAKSAEEITGAFYNTVGWKTVGTVTEDAERFEDLRECARDYVSRCRLRVLRHIPARGEHILDMASGPIQYPEYLTYCQGFRKRHCVDLSAAALEGAKQKIGDHGEFHHGSFFQIVFPDDHFDCSISLHTIYHMDKDAQEQAVRKLLRVTKPEHPVIIVYSNPQTLLARMLRAGPVHAIRRWFGHRPADSVMGQASAGQTLYFFCHSVDWWQRFSDIADVSIYPWRSFSSNHQKRLFPNGKLGKIGLRVLFRLEDWFPHLFVQCFQYPMIVLRKRAASTSLN